jgi:hypothetical protein
MRDQFKHTTRNNAPVYGLGLIGALFYFMSHATGFWSVITGIVKSILWPAFLVYKAFAALA